MTLIIVLVSALFISFVAYISPKIAKKFFPVPVENMILNVSFPHGLAAGEHIKVEDDVLEVVRVNGSQITLRKELVS